MKQTLQLRLSQHLALTPQLQQSIRLLQLSTIELNQELEQILQDNPMLERLDDPLENCARIAPNGGLDSPASSSAGAADAAGEAAGSGDGAGADGSGASESANGDADAAPDGALLDWSGSGERGARGDSDDDTGFAQIAGADESLKEHLSRQLASTKSSPRDRALVQLLIEELDDAGMLGSALEELHEALPAELEVELDELTAALRLLQSFDPTGVGARSIGECLDLQLAALPLAGTEHETRRLARRIVIEHLDLLAARDHTRLKRLLPCTDEQLREAHAMIRRLDPRPGNAFGGDRPAYVVPDVVVRRVRGQWQASLNRDVMPRLRINDVYAQILKRQRSNSGSLGAQLQEARWLIKNVQQRFDTILRVAQAIVDRQRAFFTHGAVAMRPLVLREIADTLGLHESTVSRVTTQKYMLTSFGTFELKYFFGSHVATESGGAASSTAIRALLKQLVAAEDPSNPLSDSRLAEMLGEQGIVVARRTVAKYREALQIAPVAQRRAL